MTEYERDVRKGLASVKRVYRRADSLGEVLERHLQRLYRRQTVPRKRAEVESLVKEFYSFRDQVAALEQALARDYISIISP